ncbi:hypothetical protein [Azospirillum sp.]|uniref:hypothetical protein n=1 Tax=Azospirillum sp. TaxID=34012 RepID=UPI002D727799|nr:hypothetical protein [Azospirillum sp.]HYD64147.1 hypothetical protein [Azospirillum sp.]
MGARPRPLWWLRKQLLQGLPLPKDRWVDQQCDGGELHEFHIRDRRDERRILLALIDQHNASRGEKNRALRVALCRPHHPCRDWACFLCRHRAWEEMRAKAVSLSAGLRPHSISWLTIIAGAAEFGIPQVEAQIEDTSASLNQLLNGWPNVTVIGRYEVDYWGQNQHIPDKKRKTLESFNVPVDGSVPLLVPHLHAIVFHPGRRREFIRIPIAKRFPGAYRVLLGPLRHYKSTEDNLDALIRYPLKFELPEWHRQDPSDKALRYFCRLIDTLGGLNGKLCYEFPIRSHS